MRSTVLMTIFAIGGLAAGATSAHAQCGGGGGGGYYRGGGYGGGHTFGRGSGGYYGGGGCGMMMMGGMQMGGMQTPAPQAPAASMPGMDMNGPAAPAATATPTAVAASYHCPMHPNVMSTFPATCPYCQMALKRK